MKTFYASATTSIRFAQIAIALVGMLPIGRSQETQNSTGEVLVSPVAAQSSRAIDLPEDFFVRIEGGSLQVALEVMAEGESQRSPANLAVRLIDQQGVEKTTLTDGLGFARFENVKADSLYAVVAADGSTGVHAAVAFMTAGDEMASRKGITASKLRLPLIAADRNEVVASISRDIPPTFALSGSFNGLDDYTVQGANLFRVRLHSDGKLNGRIVIADRGLSERLRYAKLTFFRGSQVVGRADASDIDGSFSVKDLSPGVHGVMAAGPAGYAVFAFDVLPAMLGGNRGENISRPVAFEARPSDTLFVFLVPPHLASTVTGVVRDTFRKPTTPPNDSGVVPNNAVAGGYGPMGPGFGRSGFGGGGVGGNGGGSGGSGGGFGGFSGLGGIASVLAVALSDNSNSTAVVSPISSQ
jgi:hypothetical protein